MSIFAIGDIHGNLSALKTIFAQNMITPEDTVVFLGDYVDRGPDSKGVIDWLIDNSEHYQFEFILGNHEIMMKSAISNQDERRNWLYFGGSETLSSYGIRDDINWPQRIPKDHWKFIDNCKLYLQLDKFLFVHAGFEPGKAPDDQNKHHLLWKKYETPEQYSNDYTVICGHTSRKNGQIAYFGHTICIDTNAYGGQWLTCLNVESLEYIQTRNSGEIKTGILK